MTAPQSTVRRRKKVAGERMPDELLAWFAGESPPGDIPWSALLPPECDRLLEWWAEYATAHPEADPPPYVAGLLRNLWHEYVAAHPGAVPPPCIARLLDEGTRP